VDLGTGCGIIPLIVAHRRRGVRLLGVEIQEGLAAIAEANVRANGFEGRIAVLRADLKTLPPDAAGGPVDWVVSNPPYRRARSGRLNPQTERAFARHELLATLEDILAAASRLLKRGGRFMAVYPAERLVDLMAGARAASLEPKWVRMIEPRAGSEANRVLLSAVKGGGTGIRVAVPLRVYGEGKTYSAEVASMLSA